MKVPNKVKQIAERIAKIGIERRELCSVLIAELEKLGIDTEDKYFVDSVWSYLEGDCSTRNLIQYLEDKQ